MRSMRIFAPGDRVVANNVDLSGRVCSPCDRDTRPYFFRTATSAASIERGRRMSMAHPVSMSSEAEIAASSKASHVTFFPEGGDNDFFRSPPVSRRGSFCTRATQKTMGGLLIAGEQSPHHC
jgi:hypothetical protein